MTEPKIAYFSMEIAVDPAIPTYSGGLGVLSGDTVRAAADVHLPMVAVTLLYRQGFFHQHLDQDGTQRESPANWSPERYMEHQRTRVTVQIEGREVVLGAWLFNVRGASGSVV